MPEGHCHLKPKQKKTQARFGFDGFKMGSIPHILLKVTNSGPSRLSALPEDDSTV